MSSWLTEEAARVILSLPNSCSNHCKIRSEFKSQPESDQAQNIIASIRVVIPVTNLTPGCIEKRPDWAWNMAGYWTQPSIHPNVLPITMAIYLSNNAKDTKIGRQYHAELTIPDHFNAIVRFCPSSTEPLTLEDVEEKCILKHGCWPGPAPRGQTTWYIRWRRSNRSEREEKSSETQSEISFAQDDTRRLHMMGKFNSGNMEIPLNFSKQSDTVLSSTDGTSFKGHWYESSSQGPKRTGNYPLAPGKSLYVTPYGPGSKDTPYVSPYGSLKP